MRTILLEIKYEFLRLLRVPRYSVSVVTFPVMFYVFFGIVMRNGTIGNVGAAVYVLCTMAVFGMMFAPMLGLGAGIATERNLGWMEVKRASPMPPAGWFIAKICGAMIFCTIILSALFALAFTLGGVRMGIGQAALLAAAFLGGAIPFAALGFLLGHVVTSNSAPAMINLVAMPMAFCSGLWVPLPFLPHPIQQIAQALPAYHLSEMSQALAGATGHGSIASHVQALASITSILIAGGWLVWRRDENRIHVG
ncbi:MAG TPA: ABC transporter permease [Bryobacteraceae bacterium]|nr:ABC transporter permease [Bryobacteraceae bacterium]